MSTEPDGYVMRLTGRLERPLVVVRLRTLAEDGTPAAAAELPIIGGDRVGRVRAMIWAGDEHDYPPQWQPGGAITDVDGTLVVDYLPGLRGGLGETGVTLEPITVKSYAALRATNHDLPVLRTRSDLLAWLRSGSILG